MPIDREEQPPCRILPPQSFLDLFGLEGEIPEEVYCASCSDWNEGRGVFLFLRLGQFGVDLRNRGRWPNDPALGQWRGKRRDEWTLIKAKQCDRGHITVVRADGTLVHTGNTGDSAPPRVVRARA